MLDGLNFRRVVICCGSGGVGKTTTSAALAIRAALNGKTAVVITIDPAKRLATSLGLKHLTNEPTDLTEKIESVRQRLGLSKGEQIGRFFAVMPDTTQTFEHFVKTMAGGNENLAARVLKTSIYKVFAKEFSGTNEYMAMEKLFQLYSEKKYDVIILDTPPSANTRVFLEAPQMLAGFFDDRIMKWFLAPGSKLLASGLKKLLEVLEKLTGHGFVSELIEFTSALFELRGQFMDNLNAVARLLHQSDVGFCMVTSPERLSKNDTQDFVALLKAAEYQFCGFIVNRVLSKKLGVSGPDDFSKSVSSLDLTAEKRKVFEEALRPVVAQLEHEKDATDFLKRTDQAGVLLVAEQESDVHSVEALVRLSREL